MGAFAEVLYQAQLGDTIYFNTGVQGLNGDDCSASGGGCCGQRPNGGNGTNTYIGTNSNLNSNYALLANGGAGGNGSGITCGWNGYIGSVGANGTISLGSFFNSSGFIILNSGLSQCKYGYCAGDGKVIIRW